MFREMNRSEQRRHPRSRVAWPAVVEAGDRLIHVETLDVGPLGAKIRLPEPLAEGTMATLHLSPPEGNPVDVRAIVWRTDEDGSAFYFIEPAAPAAR